MAYGSMTFGSIQTAVREELDTWNVTVRSDSLVKRKINEGYHDFCEATGILRKTAQIALATSSSAETTLTTTDATATTIAYVPMSEGYATLVQAIVVGNQSDGTDAGSSIITGLFSRATGGDATQQGDTESSATELPTGWDVDFSVDTDDQRVNVVVTGVASTTIVWTCDLSVSAVPDTTVELEGVNVYALPADVMTPIRFEWDGSRIDVQTTAYMDEYYGDDWKTQVGTNVQCVIHDNDGEGYIRVYPLIDDATYIDGKPLKVTYIYKPADLSATADVPAIPSQYHKYLVNYAVGNLYNVNKGVDRNPLMGEVYLRKYYRAVQMAKKQAVLGFSERPNRIIPNIKAFG